MSIGLCETCTFHSLVTNSHGGEFHLCEKHETDHTFPKYPRLPVMTCRGWVSTKDAKKDKDMMGNE